MKQRKPVRHLARQRIAQGPGPEPASRRLSTGEAEEAQPWFQRAADAGHAEAMDGLACVYDYFEDHEQALRWFERAAEAGSASGAQNLRGHAADQARGGPLHDGFER